jgi:hypothetical protein
VCLCAVSLSLPSHVNRVRASAVWGVRVGHIQARALTEIDTSLLRDTFAVRWRVFVGRTVRFFSIFVRSVVSVCPPHLSPPPLGRVLHRILYRAFFVLWILRVSVDPASAD